MPKKRSRAEQAQYKAALRSCQLAHGRKKGVTRMCKRIAAASVGMRGLRGDDDAMARYKAKQAAEREEGIRAGKERWARMREIEAKYPGTYPNLNKATYPGFAEEFPGRGMGGLRGTPAQHRARALELVEKAARQRKIGDYSDAFISAVSANDEAHWLGHSSPERDASWREIMASSDPSSMALRPRADTMRLRADALGDLGCACSTSTSLAGRKRKRKRS